MKKKLLMSLFFCTVICAANSVVFAQDQTPRPKHLLREDSAAVNALVLYPDTIRLDIFEACEFPASIVSIATLQKNTSSDFANLVSSYSKEEQEDFWNLSRYSDLVSRLAQGGPKSQAQINDILADYPDDIRDAALRQGINHYDVLQKMDALQSNTNAQFEQILTDYPPVTQGALRDLIRYPEIINLLNDHLSLAVRVGDHYRRNPQRVINWADSLNNVEVRQNAQDAATWKQNIEQNPDEANDLKSAANDYAQENGYTQDDINASPDPNYVSNYTCTPYSYWFGYPSWYPYSYWYPYPFWFDCGFYYNHGRMVMLGTPSYYFTNWYFYHPEHWRQYPHLGNRYISHYYGSGRMNNSNAVIVHNWVRDNRSYLPKDFVTNNSRRVEVIKQVGQLHMDAQKEQGGKQVPVNVREEYLKNNATKYPSLSASPQTRMEPQEGRQNVPNIIQQPTRQPNVRIPNPAQQPAPNQRQATQQPNFNNINRAQDYHRSVWQQTQPTPRPQPQQAPRQQMQQAPRQAPSNMGSPGGGGRRK